MRKITWRTCGLTMLFGSSFIAAQQLPPPADAPAAGTAQGDVSITIYTNYVALVQDIRSFEERKGRPERRLLGQVA